ncbi:WD40-repeat-containing domain protein [Panaeolus papilionaceus]|nr:WD40-repeat-containing domain protein [Panaeolus papilionaceus]
MPGREVIAVDDTLDELLLTSSQRLPQQPYPSIPNIPPFRPHSTDTTTRKPLEKLGSKATSSYVRSKMSSSASVPQGPRQISASTSTVVKPSAAQGTSDDPMVLSDYESSEAESDEIVLLEVRKGPPRRDLHISGIQSIPGEVYYGSASESKAGVKGRGKKVSDSGKKAPMPPNPKCFQSADGPPINHPSSLRDLFSPKKRSAASVPVDNIQPGSSKARKMTESSTPTLSRSSSLGISLGSRQNTSRESQQRVQKRPSTLLDTLELTDSDNDTSTRVHKKQRRDDRAESRDVFQPQSPEPVHHAYSPPEPGPSSSLSVPLPTRQRHQRRPRPRPPPDPRLDVSDDSDYDFYHSGLDIHDEDNWAPMKLNEKKLDLLAKDIQVKQGSQTARRSPTDVNRQVVLPSRNTTRFSLQRPGTMARANFIWDKLRKAQRATFPAHKYRFPFIQFPTSPMPAGTRILPQEHNLHSLELEYRYRPCPRSINRIIQKDGWVVSGGACAGGGPDHTYGPEQNLDNENAPGALVAYARGSKEVILDAHKRENFRRQGDIKYYAVHDVQFLPFEHRNSFLSTGADGVVQQWNPKIDYEQENNSLDEYWTNTHFDVYHGVGSGASKAYPRIPFGVLFNPTSSSSSSRCLVAVTERKLNIYSINTEENRTRRNIITSFTLKSPNSANLVGSTLWGQGITANQLFASSEPELADDFSGVHKAFDVGHNKPLYQFDAKEGGDDMALDSAGRTLALCTLAEGERSVLRLYDVARKSPLATTTIDLEEIRAPAEAESFTKEVSCSAFSPDSVFLALARTDNSIYIYDTRMLQNGPMFKYSHSNAPSVCANNGHFGVVKAEWIHSDVTRRMGLVTAGEDGCVRLWNPMIAVDNPENGKVLAELDYDITTFCLGDRFKQQYPLVVGDSTGQISLFNKLVI